MQIRGMRKDNCEWDMDWDREEVPVVELHKGHMKLLSLHQTVPSLLPSPPSSLPLPSSNIPLHPVPIQFQSHPFVIVICSFLPSPIWSSVSSLHVSFSQPSLGSLSQCWHVSILSQQRRLFSSLFFSSLFSLSLALFCYLAWAEYWGWGAPWRERTLKHTQSHTLRHPQICALIGPEWLWTSARAVGAL